MESIYIFMIVALAILAIADLVVGVSNDAVNFLNSAIGSKAVAFKTIMIVASLGIAFGALSSSGMMEVARKGIFVPSQFYFNEIMIIFMAVMITDIILLDIFNTLGLPTSTTVSIVFELLGAAVCISLLKINASDSATILDLGGYINSSKASEIIIGILLSVVIAFTIGALIQFITRYLLTFETKRQPVWATSIFGGLAFSAIVYFIIIKGLKGADVLPITFSSWVKENLITFLGINFGIWTIVSYILHAVLKVNIYRITIVLGTFALAMAFAGNDLVNFIGVPMAAYNSFEAWSSSGLSPENFSMDILSEKVAAQPLLLLAAGFIMILTLWFSEKSKRVVKTSVDLARQSEGEERFKPNWLSQNIVRTFIGVNTGIKYILPKKAQKSITEKFKKPAALDIPANDAPAFDMVRAAVNLVVAAVLISVATGYKLPLSTTYVTFMVTMGTSLADRAWGTESAVYRVAGVINVIGGWFMTAATAFLAACTMAFIMYKGGHIAVIALFAIAVFMFTRNYLASKQENKEVKKALDLRRAESKTIRGIVKESADNIANTLSRANSIYTTTLSGLSRNKLGKLKKNKKTVEKLNDELFDLRNNLFFFIKNLEETSIRASNFYIETLGYLEDISQSLEHISKASFKHVNNNHKPLRFNQIRDLQEINKKLNILLENAENAFAAQNFNQIESLINQKKEIFKQVNKKIEKQVARTRSEDSSPRNTTLYFSILLETKDILKATYNLLELYYSEREA